MNIIRVLLFLAADLGWSFHQIDVKNAFLHGDLKKEVLVEAPQGFDDGFK